MAYEVHLDVYDGPFDLLLQLITGRELDVYAVPLADIVDAFVAEIGRLEEIDLDRATEFLLIAATLIELKCRRLLPGSSPLELDEELSLFEARDYLLARLVECRTFSLAGRALSRLEEQAGASVPRRNGPDETLLGLVPETVIGLDATDLAGLAVAVLAGRPAPPAIDAHVHVDEVSVEEVLAGLLERLPRLGTVSFKALTKSAASTAEVVASFLALLELYKSEKVDLEQGANFGELRVTWTGSRASSEHSREATVTRDLVPARP